MRALIVTAGEGMYEPFAAALCSRLRKLNPRARCHDASREVAWARLRTPHWCKVFLDPPRGDWDWLVWMDPDVFTVRALPLDEIPEDVQFAAALDWPLTCGVEMAKFPPARICEKYFNTGVFALRRDAIDVLSDLRSMMDAEEQGACAEQSWFNVILQRRGTPTKVLAWKWNWLAVTNTADGVAPAGLVNVHAAGLGTHPRFRMLRALYAVGAEGERCGC